MESEIKSKKLDRVVLDSKSIESVKNITDQIEAELGDFVQTNPKLIINFLLQNRCEPLSKEELEKLKSENYDLVKALKRATEEAIKAKQNGSQINFNDVLKIIQTPSVKSEVAPKKARGRKRKSEGPPPTSDKINEDGDSILTNLTADSAQVKVANDSLKIPVPTYDSKSFSP